jgi:hypothetical protein
MSSLEDVECFGAIRGQIVPAAWRYEGAVRFEGDDGTTLQGLPSSFVTLDGGGDDNGMIYIRGRPYHTGEYAESGKLVLSDCSESATAEHTYCRFHSDDTGETQLKLILQQLNVGDYESAAITRETILGLQLWSHQASVKSSVFGRPAIVSDCASRASGPLDSVEVVYQGSPLVDGERAALYDVLRFVTGTRGASWFVEYFEGSGKRLGFACRLRGPAKLPKQCLQPINLSPWGERSALAASLPTMLDRMLVLRKANAPGVSATMHHYNDGSIQTYPTAQIRDLSVALESLLAAVKGGAAERVAMPFITDFASRIKPVLETFDDAFGDLNAGQGAAERSRIRTKIEQANMMSPRQELFEFLERLDIGFQSFEKKMIDSYRNGILHVGHKGDEAEFNTLQANSEAASTLANLFHRGLLRQLGYDGQYRNARDGRSHNLREAPKYALLQAALRG